MNKRPIPLLEGFRKYCSNLWESIKEACYESLIFVRYAFTGAVPCEECGQFVKRDQPLIRVTQNIRGSYFRLKVCENCSKKEGMQKCFHQG